jgi:hypothetical protein
MMSVHTFWLSFTDPHKPAGHKFLGVCVVDVDELDALEATRFLLPQSKPGAEWIMAAARKAWRTGCNPGGQIASVDIPAEQLHELAETPRNRLLQKGELARLGHLAQ